MNSHLPSQNPENSRKASIFFTLQFGTYYNILIEIVFEIVFCNVFLNKHYKRALYQCGLIIVSYISVLIYTIHNPNEDSLSRKRYHWCSLPLMLDRSLLNLHVQSYKLSMLVHIINKGNIMLCIWLDKHILFMPFRP